MIETIRQGLKADGIEVSISNLCRQVTPTSCRLSMIPRTKEHEAMLEWCGGPFNPTDFRLDDINASLRQIKL